MAKKRRRTYKHVSFILDVGLAHPLRRGAIEQDKSVRALIRELAAVGLEKHQVEKQVMEALKTLTPREREVVLWVARGDTNKQIAQELTISEETVKTHIRNILHKLNLRTKVELRIYLNRLGLVFSK